jgi:predicted regulator of Ras-like GTPase activity (Roadblock/LC7/MglB family)
MRLERLNAVLDRVTRVRGVRGAMLVSSDDGLTVAEALMEGIRGHALAALAASLATRLGRAAEASGAGRQRFLHVAAEQGALLLLPVSDTLLLVAIADRDVNVGLTRLEMQRAGEALR